MLTYMYVWGMRRNEKLQYMFHIVYMLDWFLRIIRELIMYNMKKEHKSAVNNAFNMLNVGIIVKHKYETV